MKSFSVTSDQLASCISAVCADELGRAFAQHNDLLTVISWSPETALGLGGIGLVEEQWTACQKRVAAFFGIDAAKLSDDRSALVADWVHEIETQHAESLTEFSFVPAGKPREGDAFCQHPADVVFQDAAAAANLLYGRRRLLSVVSPHSLFGFVTTILSPNLQRIETVDVRGATPEVISETLEYGDVLVATPSLWRYMSREGLKAPDNVMGVSFGEPMTPDLAADLRKEGFGALREFYGSTETGLVGWRDSPTEPFSLFDHLRKKDGDLVRLSPTDEEVAVQPMDVLVWEEDNRFRLEGRRDGAVQIGAVNVFPDQIARIIMSHPAVEECLIRVGLQGEGVNRLIAHITLDEACPPNEKTARDIDAWCRSKLAPHERPRIYNFELELPRE